MKSLWKPNLRFPDAYRHLAARIEFGRMGFHGHGARFAAGAQIEAGDAAGQRAGVGADEGGGAGDFQRDRDPAVRLRVAIGIAMHEQDARHIRAVGPQLAVIEVQRKHAGIVARREALFGDDPVADIAYEEQLLP